MQITIASAAAPTTQSNMNKAPLTIDPNNIFGLRAAWLHFASEIEVKRLALLQARINRRERAVKEMINERQLIMNRCIRRMRRSNGKN